MKDKTRAMLTALAIAAAAAMPLAADDFDLSWHTMDGGGGYSAGGGFELEGTIGQPDASSVNISGNGFQFTGGFWSGAQAPTPALPGDCNSDGLVDLVDYSLFESCLFGPGGELGAGCACFDFDIDGDTDLADAAAFQAHFAGQ